MKRVIVGVLCALLMGTLTGCGANQDKIDEAFDNAANVISDTKDALSGLTEEAKKSLNYLGSTLNLNGEYATTVDRLSAFADDFKAQVTTKLEEINPEYVVILQGQIANMKTMANSIKTMDETIPLQETGAYQFFSNFDYRTYDMTYTVLKNNDTVIRNHVILDTSSGNLNAYSTAYEFSLDSSDNSSVFELFGLIYQTCENNVWYECNQLKRTKTVTDYSMAVSNIEALLNKYYTATYKASTSYSLIDKNTDYSLARFVDANSDITYVCEQGVLKAILVNTENDLQIIIINEIKAEPKLELLEAAKEYTISK